MNARETILERMAAHSRSSEMPHPWRSRREYMNLSEQFAAALITARGEVYIEKDLQGAVDRLDMLLKELKAKKVVLDAGGPLRAPDFERRFREIQWYMVGEISPDDWRQTCAVADVGITTGDAGLAETGSLVIGAGPGRSRLTSLLPPTHIALLPASRLTTDLFTWLSLRPEVMPSKLVIISGPSKTADIEQTLVVGVHGPRRFVVIVYQD